MELAVMAEEKVGAYAQWTNGNGFEVQEEESYQKKKKLKRKKMVMVGLKAMVV